MSKAIVTLPEGQFSFDTETGWSGKWDEIVTLLNRDYPPGTKPPTMFAYLAEPAMAPAYAVAEDMGGLVIVIRDASPEDELPEPEVVERGGPGSGHHGHKGIPKHRGGSLPGDQAPEPEKPKPPATTAAAHGEVFDYKRRLPRPKQWVWGDGWMDKVTPEGAPNHWLKMLAREGKKKMRREFAELASIYWRNPTDSSFAGGDWFRFFRKDLDAGSQSSYMYWSARDLLRAGHEFNDAWGTEDEVKDAVADMYAAEFASYYKKFAKGREVGARLSEKRGDWAKSKKFMPPTKDFFSIPGTERWDPVRAGLQAMADAGIRLPESWKARYSSPTDEGLLPVKETRGTSLWGRYTDMAGMADSIAINLTDIRSEGETSATMVHEVGHMIEHLGFDWGDGAKFPAVESYYSAVKASGYPERIRGAHYPRISRQVEVFARGFMQYTTSKLRKASPTAQKRNKAFIERMEANVVKAQMPDEPPLYYSWDEFEGVEAAMDKMFEVGIWRK
jgi:hypothetical protein